MMNKYYWKNAYQDYWNLASTKEKKIKFLVERETGLKLIENGLGAGSNDLVNGDAKDNGLNKGDADFYIEEKDCYIEVTGPNIKMDFDRPLWIRPDKLRNAYRKIQNHEGKLHVVVHVLEQLNSQTVLRVVVLNHVFFDHIIEKKSFKKVNPIIRGNKETYYEIPPIHETIISFEEFLKRLRLM